jgi:ParB family transcriptional regulator, chromosome partitioning protein
MSRLYTSSNSILGIIEEIEISKIQPAVYCIRRSQDYEAEDLARSILQKGLLHPVIVRMKGDYFEIVAGNRRYNACKKLGWRKIICHIVEVTDQEAFEISLTENVQKKTLNPIDEALAFKSYIKDYGWGGTSDLAEKLGRSISYISKRINLLDLPSDVIDSIINSTIDTSIAEELLYVTDKQKQSKLAELISKRNISLRNARTIIKDSKNENQDIFESFLSVKDSEFEEAQKSFDKSIIAVRIAHSKLGSIIQDNDEKNWLIYELLMQHKNMLHGQIDLLIKYKKKYNEQKWAR